MKITLDDFLDAVEKAHTGMDITGCWPAHPAQIEAYFSDLIALRIFSKYKEDKEKFLEGLKKVPVDSIRTHLYSSGIIGLKVARIFEHKDISPQEIEDFILAIIENIQGRVFNDALCRDGKNLLYPPEQVERWLSRDLVAGLTDEEKREVAGFNVTAESLVWALFYDLYRSGGFNISGPYETKKGKVLVRECFDLSPPFWPFRYKYKYLQKLLVYDDDAEVECDFANHFLYKEPIVSKLKAFRVESDTELFDSVESIIKLTDYLESLRKRHTEHVESLEPLEIIAKGAEIYSYLFKGLWDYYGEDWRPGAEIEERIKKVGLKYWHRYGLVREKKERPSSYYRKLYDPRSSLIG